MEMLMIEDWRVEWEAGAAASRVDEDPRLPLSPHLDEYGDSAKT